MFLRSSSSHVMLLLLLGLGLTLSACTSEAPGGGGAVPSAPSDEPDAFIKVTMQAMEDGKPEMIWGAMPSSYRADITSLIHDFGDKMDAEVWNRSFAVLSKVVKLLKDKKELILASPMVGGNPMVKLEDLESNWDSVVRFIDMIVNSEMKTVEGVKSLDVAKFLAKTGGEMMQMFEAGVAAWEQGANHLNKLKNTSTTVVKREGDVATVKIEMPGEPATEEQFIKVDGYWVPKELADNWSKSMDEARAGLAKITLSDEDKMQFNQVAGKIDAALDELLAAQDQAAFDGALTKAMMGLMSGGSSPPGK